MNESAISWTKVTWNPTHGCSRVSDGCRHCYAETLSLKRGWTKLPWTASNASQNVMLKPHKLREPYKLKPGTKVFVNSMSDLFHEEIPDSYLSQIFGVMNDLPLIEFQVLTKRPERASAWPGPWADNIWMGASIENKKALPRIDMIRQSGAAIKFLSIEPLLEDLGQIDLTGINWVIVGGESGKGYRPMDHAWARSIRDQCVKQNVAFFFKQSAAWRTEIGTELIEEDGSKTIWQEYPRGRCEPIAA